MSTVPAKDTAPISHQPDLGGKTHPVTGKGEVNLDPPKQGSGPQPLRPKLGK